MRISSYLKKHQQRIDMENRKITEVKKKGDKNYINFLENQMDKIGKNSLKIETIMCKIDKLTDTVISKGANNQVFDNKIFKLETKIYELSQSLDTMKKRLAEGTSKFDFPEKSGDLTPSASRRAKSVRSHGAFPIENYNHPLTKPIFRKLNGNKKK